MAKGPRPPNIEVPREALLIWPFAKIEKENPTSLGNIRIQPVMCSGPGKSSIKKFHAVASDGTSMIHVWWTPKPEDVLDGAVEIEADAVKFLLSEIAGKGGSKFSLGKDRQYHLHVEKGRYMLDTSQNEAIDAGPAAESASQLAKWQDVIPKRRSDTAKVAVEYGLDLAKLQNFIGYLKEFNEDAKVKVNYFDPDCLGPILFIPCWTPNDGPEVEFVMMGDRVSAEFVLMPCRL